MFHGIKEKACSCQLRMFYANIENKSEISFKLDPNLYNRL